MQAIYFTAPWCAPCKTFGPIMDAVDIPVVKMNVDDFPTMTQQYGVRSVPTVILVKDKEGEVGRFSGARSAEFVNQFIASHA